MLRFLARRLLIIPVILIGLSLITFVVSRLVPGDPVKLAAGPQARPEQIEKLAKEFGMDLPLPQQYLNYMAGLFQGNWGYSISTKREVGKDLITYFAATLELTIVSTLVGLIVGEKLMGVAGMILAPVILNYLKIEASRISAPEPKENQRLNP